MAAALPRKRRLSGLDRVVHRAAGMDGPYLMTLVIEDVTNCCHNRGQAGLLLAARTETVFLISSISALSLASRAALRRLDRFRESDILRHVFERVVAGCMVNGLVKGEGFAVDASVTEANASRYHGKAPDDLDWTDAHRQKRAVPEYLAALEAEPGSQDETEPRNGDVADS